MNERLEELGENRQNFMENLKAEKNNHNQANTKLKEVQREMEKLQGLDKVR